MATLAYSVTKRDRRFELRSFHFNDLIAVVYDNEKKEELRLSIHGLVQLLNDVTQQNYDIKRLKTMIDEDFNKIMNGDEIP